MKKKWFVYSRLTPASEKEAILFRKKFKFHRNENDNANISLYITADSRYQLFLNGSCICRGPAAGDGHISYYDELDVTEYLRSGENCIAVRVLHYPAGDDGVQRFAFGPTMLPGTYYGGLCVFCSSERVDVNTNQSWKCRRDASYEFRNSTLAKYAGDVEYVDTSAYPFGWELPEYDDSSWENVRLVQEAGTEEAMEYGILRNWVLKKREIPLLRETGIQPAAIHNAAGGIGFEGLREGRPVTVPPGMTAVCEIDMGRMVTGYVRSEFAEGSAGEVEYLVSEAYYQKNGDIYYKERRDDREGGVLLGETDGLRLCGRAFVYEPFEYRAFRYMRLTVKTQEKPVILNRIAFRQLDYPLDIMAEFTAEDRELEKIWEISLHTLRCCMKDTYMDCPFYERLQYLMDTVIEASHTYMLSGDDRLAKKALQHFASTQMANGMIHCDAPSNDRHVIPGFAIYFIDMLSEHYLFFGEKELLRRYWGVCVRILDFFEERLQEETGLAGPCGYWEFADWTEEWEDTKGVPRGSYLSSLMYAYGLLLMTKLTEALYGQGTAQIWRKRYEGLRERINRSLWDGENQYYRTGSGERKFSCHAQVWAVLGQCIEGGEARRLMLRTIGNPALVRCSYSMQHYYRKALEQAGVRNTGNEFLKDYRKLLKMGLTTWPEDPVTARSDCHGWSIVPISVICRALLGIKPVKGEERTLLIEPENLELGTMAGSAVTPSGRVRVERRVVPDKQGMLLDLSVRLEQKQRVTLRLAGKDIKTEYCDELKYRAVLGYDEMTVQKEVSQ